MRIRGVQGQRDRGTACLDRKKEIFRDNESAIFRRAGLTHFHSYQYNKSISPIQTCCPAVPLSPITGYPFNLIYFNFESNKTKQDYDDASRNLPVSAMVRFAN